MNTNSKYTRAIMDITLDLLTQRTQRVITRAIGKNNCDRVWSPGVRGRVKWNTMISQTCYDTHFRIVLTWKSWRHRQVEENMRNAIQHKHTHKALIWSKCEVWDRECEAASSHNLNNSDQMLVCAYTFQKYQECSWVNVSEVGERTHRVGRIISTQSTE